MLYLIKEQLEEPIIYESDQFIVTKSTKVYQKCSIFYGEDEMNCILELNTDIVPSGLLKLIQELIAKTK